jgi:hypothetical protein
MELAQWLDGWMGGWMDGWMAGWMDGAQHSTLNQRCDANKINYREWDGMRENGMGWNGME